LSRNSVAPRLTNQASVGDFELAKTRTGRGYLLND
jgi:hypothetical protein